MSALDELKKKNLMDLTMLEYDYKAVAELLKEWAECVRENAGTGDDASTSLLSVSMEMELKADELLARTAGER